MSEETFNEYNGENRVQTKEETDKKCPACGGVMDFDPKTGGLLCPFCGQQLTIETNVGNTKAEELDFDTAQATANCDWGAEKKTVICKSCGAQLVYDALQISDECPYCGSNQVMEEKGQDTLAPGGVCVFKVDKASAGINFKSWIKGKLFCPRKAKQKAKPETFKGVYLPYWTFDTQTASMYTARYGINRTVRDRDGNTRTVTDWYHTAGDYAEFINDQLVPASDRQNLSILPKIEPFNTEDNLLYKPEYVAGFISERYTVGLKDAWQTARASIENRLSKNIERKIMSEHHASHVDSLQIQTNYYDKKYKYLLLPVWMSSFKYKEKIYQFMVNGQTGKVGGKTPISALRVMIAVVLGLAVLTMIYLIAKNYGGM